MLNQFVMPDLYPAAPEVLLLIMACVILLADLTVGRVQRWITPVLTLVTLLGCAFLTYSSLDGMTVTTFSGMFVDDLLSDFLKLALYVAVIAVIIYSRGYLMARNLDKGEFYLLVLFATLGMM